MPDHQGKYTLDELLRAKRRERPEPQFWTSFERELKSKQRVLIQKQLANDTRLSSPSAARFYKFGALTASCGIAAFAVVIGLRTNQSDPSIVAEQVAPATIAPLTPSFSVATSTPKLERTEVASGLQEFATFAQPSSPRVVVRESQVAAKAPTASQISALETIAQLEKKIRAKRSNQPPSRYEFVSSSGLFELDNEPHEETVAETLSSFEQAYLLGKYADPLNRSFESAQSPFQGSRVNSLSFSQIDEALSVQGPRRDKSLDALNVRF